MKNSKFMQQHLQPGKEGKTTDSKLMQLFAAAGQAMEETPLPVSFGKAANDIVAYMLQNRENVSEQHDMSALLMAWVCVCKDEAGKEDSAFSEGSRGSTAASARLATAGDPRGRRPPDG